MSTNKDITINPKKQSTEVLFAEMIETDEQLVSLIALRLQDNLSQETRDAVAHWRRRGLDIWIASGDSAMVTHSIARELGLPPENAHGGLSPEDKLNLLNRLQSGGRKVMMIGDGLNDSACLSAADVGVAVKGAVDLALNCSDVYLKKPGLGNVARFIQFARYSHNSLKLALALSAIYNVVALVFALSHRLHPLTAALIMPMTSLSCFLLLALRGGKHIWKS